MRLRRLLYKKIFAREEKGFTLVEILMVLGIFSTALLMVVNIFVTSTRLQQRTLTAQRLSADARFTLETMARAIRSGTVDYDFYHARTPYVSTEYEMKITDPSYPLHVLSVIDPDGNRTIFRRQSLDPVNDPWGNDKSGGFEKVGDKLEVCLESNLCIDPTDYEGSSKTLCNSDSECGETGESCLLSCNYQGAWSDITPEGVRLTGGSQHPTEPYGFKVTLTPPYSPFLIQNNETGEYKADEQPRVSILMITKGNGNDQDELKEVKLQTTVSTRVYGR